MKKNILSIILAVAAVVAIVFCFVLNGQKSNVQKTVDDLTKQIEDVKTDAAKQLEDAKAEAEKLIEDVKAEAAQQLEDAKAEAAKQLEDAKAEAAKQLEDTKAEAAKQLEEAMAEAERKAEEAAKAAEEAARKAAEEEAAQKAAEEEAARKAAEEEAARKAAEEEAALKAAEEAAAKAAVVVDASIAVDGDLTPLLGSFISNEEQLTKLSALFEQVRKVLQAASLRITAGQNIGQIEQLVNGAPLATVTVRANEAGDGAEIISDLFPSTMITVSKEALEEILSSYTKQYTQLSLSELQAKLESLDIQGMMQTVTAAVGEMVQTFQASAGEPETGSFEINGVEYTTKIPFNMTAKEAEVLVLSTVKKIVSDDAISAFLTENVPGFTTETLDQTLEKVSNTDDAQFPPLDAAMYSNEAGAACLSATLGEGDTAMKCLISSAESGIVFILDAGTVKADINADMQAQKISFNVDLGATGSIKGTLTAVSENSYSLEATALIAQNSVSLNLTATRDEGRFDLTGTITFNMIPINLNASVTTAEDRSDLVFALSVPTSADNPLTVTVKGSMTHGAAPVFEVGEDLKVVTLEDLQKNEEAASALTQEITGSAQQLLGKFMGMFPDLFTAISEFQASQSAPAVEAVPAE